MREVQDLLLLDYLNSLTKNVSCGDGPTMQYHLQEFCRIVF